MKRIFPMFGYGLSVFLTLFVFLALISFVIPSSGENDAEKNGLICEDGSLYYYVEGKRQTGWFTVGNVRYYASVISGKVITYDHIIGGRQYFWTDGHGLTLADGLYENKGSHIYGTLTPEGVATLTEVVNDGMICFYDGYLVTGWRHSDGSPAKVENGVWEQYSAEPDGLYYFYASEFTMVTDEVQTIGGFRREFGPDHTVKALSGLQLIEDKLYYYHGGTKQIGWKTVDGNRYYFLSSTCAAAVMWQTVGGKLYYFYAGSSAVPFALKTSGPIGGIEYSYSENGFVNAVGFMNTEYAVLSRNNTKPFIGNRNSTCRYYVNGQPVTGWKNIDGEDYYFDPHSGYLNTRSRIIDGTYYEFADSGECLGKTASDPSGDIELVKAVGKAREINDHLTEKTDLYEKDTATIYDLLLSLEEAQDDLYNETFDTVSPYIVWNSQSGRMTVYDPVRRIFLNDSSEKEELVMGKHLWCFSESEVNINADISTYILPDINGYEKRSAIGVTAFSVPVRIMLTGEEGTDYGYIQLPKNYDENGEPVRLIVTCHGAGANFAGYKNAVNRDGDSQAYWSALGYARLDMFASPTELTGSNSEMHYGNPTVLECYRRGIEYVFRHFNVRQDGIFVLGSSMGGLSAFQIVAGGYFNVLAQIANCPVVDIYKQPYNNTWTASAATTRREIAYFFGFEGDMPAFTSALVASEAEKQYYIDNFDKVCGYNPIFVWVTDGSPYDTLSVVPTTKAGIEKEKELYDTLTARTDVPLVFFHCEDDTTVRERYTEYFYEMLRRGNSDVTLYTYPTGGHLAWDAGESVTVKDISGNDLIISDSKLRSYLFVVEHDPTNDSETARQIMRLAGIIDSE